MSNEGIASIDYQVNRATIEIVMADGSPATPEALYQAIHDADSEVRVSAALGLATQGDLSSTVIDTLFDAADWRSEPEASTSARAGIVALYQTNPAILALLLAALEENKLSLSGVAECLGEIGQATPAVIADLWAFIQQSDDPYATVSAAYSLLQLGHESDALIERLFILRRRGDMVVRQIALNALTLLKQPPPKVIDLLLVALRRGKPNAADAARGLARVGLDQPEVVAALLAASRAEDWQVRGAVLESLSAIPQPTPAVVGVFCHALSDREWFVRRQAIEGLGKLSIATPQVIASLLNLLTAEAHKAGQRIARSTAQPPIAEEEQNGRAILAEMQNSQNLRGTIAITLAQLGCINDAVIAAFLTEHGDADASVRERIIRNWWLLGHSHPTPLGVLQSALQDEAEMVRRSAAASLEKLSQR